MKKVAKICFNIITIKMDFNIAAVILVILFLRSHCKNSNISETKSLKNPNAMPIVIWHGVGDTCCHPTSMSGILKILEQSIPGIYIHSLQIGSSELIDFKNTYLMNVNDQVAMACELIANDTSLKNGYNAIGFSQGGQFLRAVAQRCPNPPMKNFISFGGQHQGVYGFPRCPGESGQFCDYLRKVLNVGVYVDWIQQHLAQAQYWHDPLHENLYKAKSLFLAEINNENIKNDTYKNNLKKLKNIVFIMFSEDKMVDPKESEWFGFYKPGQTREIVKLQDSLLYKEDWLGLREMDENGQLHFLKTIGDHMQIDIPWLKFNVIEKFLK